MGRNLACITGVLFSPFLRKQRQVRSEQGAPDTQDRDREGEEKNITYNNSNKITVVSRAPFPLRPYLHSHNKKEEKTTSGVMQDNKHLHVTKLISPPVVF